MIAHEENFQGLRGGAEQETDFQGRPAFKYILPQAPDGNSRVKVGLAEAAGQHSQRLFHSAYIRVAQVLERVQEARAEQDDKFSHVSIFH
jgi:hypothetical protein